MRNGTLKYPENRFTGYLSKRMPEPSETRLSDNSVTYGFNDFMTQCRHSSFIRCTASSQSLIGGNLPICVIMETEYAIRVEAENEIIIY